MFETDNKRKSTALDVLVLLCTRRAGSPSGAWSPVESEAGQTAPPGHSPSPRQTPDQQFANLASFRLRNISYFDTTSLRSFKVTTGPWIFNNRKLEGI